MKCPENLSDSLEPKPWPLVSPRLFVVEYNMP